MSILKKSSYLLLANIMTIIQNMIIILVLNKFYSMEEVGIYFLTLAISAPVFMFFNMDLRRVVTLDTSSNYCYFSSRFIFNLIALILSILIFILFFQEKTSYLFIFIILIINKFFESLTDFLFGLFQKFENEIYIFWSRLIRLITSVIGTLIVMFLSLNINYFVIIILFSSIITFIIIDLKAFSGNNHVKLIQTFNIDITKRIFKENWYLGASSSMVSWTTNLPVYFLEYYLGTTVVGIFSSIRYIVAGITMVTSAIGYAFLKKISLLHKKRNMLLSFMFKVEFIVAFIGIFITIIVFKYKTMIILIYNNTYEDYLLVLPILLISATFTTIIAFLNHIALSINAKKYLLKVKIYKFLLLLLLLVTYSLSNSKEMVYVVYLLVFVDMIEQIYMHNTLKKKLKEENENNVF